jgi:hypothetical protein
MQGGYQYKILKISKFNTHKRMEYLRLYSTQVPANDSPAKVLEKAELVRTATASPGTTPLLFSNERLML